MLHLTFAPNCRDLLPALHECVSELWNDPLVSPLFLVPNHSVGKWLKLRLMERFGAVAGVRTGVIEALLWDELQPDEDMKLLHKGVLQQIVCAFFEPAILSSGPYKPLRDYLGDNVDPVKRVQLAGEAARLLLEYEYNRPGVWDYDIGSHGGWRVEGVGSTWLDNKSYFSDRINGRDFAFDAVTIHEQWQRDLYIRLFGGDGLVIRYNREALSRCGMRLFTLPQLYGLRHEKRKTLLSKGPPIVLFLLSKISHFHRNMLLELSGQRDIHLFLVNPCAEFWEDVDTASRGRKRHRRKYDSSVDTDPPIARMGHDDYDRTELDSAYRNFEHRLLELWGDSGRESIALWCQAAQYDFGYLVPDMVTPLQQMSRLELLRLTLLSRDDAALGLPVAPDDRTIRIVAACDPVREVETLRENLLWTLHEHGDARLDDAVVYLPDPSGYLPAIYSVFGAYGRDDPGYVPFTVLGAGGIRGGGLFARAVSDLLGLCGGDFTRARVFSFLRNDIVSEARSLSRGEIDIWEKWAMRTGVFRGFDARHRIEMGDDVSVASEAHTFVATMARLLLGPLTFAPVPLGFDLGYDGVEPAPYRDYDTSDSEAVERFCRTIEELAVECRRFKEMFSGVAVPGDLAAQFLALLDRWTAPNSAEDEQNHRNFSGALSDVALQGEIAGRSSLSFDEFRALAEAALSGELPGSAAAWSGCLTFAPLRSGYVLAHRFVFVMGMDSEAFPGTSAYMPMNLLSARRIIGDPDTVRDNRYAFLELVCSAAEKLVISYVGRDTRADRIVQPSSVVVELAEVAGVALPDVTSPMSDSGVVTILPHEGVDPQRDIPCWDPKVAHLAALCRNVGVQRHPNAALQVIRAGDASLHQIVNITVGDIARFLKNPLEYYLYTVLGMQNESADMTLHAVDEPIESDFGTLSAIKNRIAIDLLQSACQLDKVSEQMSPTGEVERIARRRYREAYGCGNGPEGQFAAMEFNSLVTWSRHVASDIACIVDKSQEWRLFVDTDTGFCGTGTVPGYAVVLNGGSTVRITARIFALLASPDPDGSVVIVRTGRSGTNLRRSDEIDMWLIAFLFAIRGRRNIVTAVIERDNGMIRTSRWQGPDGFSVAKGKGWLTDVIGEMVESGVRDHVPAVWFEVARVGVESAATIDGNTIALLADIEERDCDQENDYPYYWPGSDAVWLTRARLPRDIAVIERTARRLSPVLNGRFDG